MHSRRKIFSFVGCAVAVTALSRRASAIDYPLSFVRIIVPFPPGGPNDVLARTIGKRLSELWRQEVTVENKPGANTQIGAELVAKSSPDGYTLMVTSDTTAVINPLLYKKLRYDPARDIVVASGIVSNYPGLFAAKSLPATSVTELIAFAKDKPGALNFGSFGLGSSGHLFMEMFQKMAGIKLAVIHYSGSGPALTDLMAGHIQLMFTNVSTAVPLVMDGKIKLLGVGSPKRFPQLLDVPTIAESGLPAFKHALGSPFTRRPAFLAISSKKLMAMFSKFWRTRRSRQLFLIPPCLNRYAVRRVNSPLSPRPTCRNGATSSVTPALRWIDWSSSAPLLARAR